MRLQFWSFRECGVVFHYHSSLLHSNSEWWYLLSSHWLAKLFRLKLWCVYLFKVIVKINFCTIHNGRPKFVNWLQHKITKQKLTSLSVGCLVSWCCRIHRLLIWRGVRPPPNGCPGYDTKQSDSEVPVMLGLWRMWSTPSLPLLLGPFYYPEW